MSSQNDLIQGIDLAGETQVSGADLEQLVREAKPNSHIAFNLFGTDSPDVTSNSRYARYIRYTSAGAWPQYYDSGTLTWTNIPLASGAVTTSKIADGAVTLEKFDTTAGTALQYLRINAGATGAEWADFTLTDATVTPAKLTAGASSQLLVTNTAGTQAEWKSAGTWFTDLATKVVPLSAITQSSGAADDVISWNGSAWVAAGVETLIPANSVPVSKLQVGAAAAYQLVRVNATATGFETATLAANSVTPGTANQVFQTDSAGGAASWRTLFSRSPAQAFGTTVSWTHGLSFKPNFVRAIVVPTGGAFQGYDQNEEIEAMSITAGGAGSFEPNPVLSVSATAMTLTLKDNNGTGNEPTIINKSTKAVYEIVSGDYSSLSVYFIYSNF